MEESFGGGEDWKEAWKSTQQLVCLRASDRVADEIRVLLARHVKEV